MPISAAMNSGSGLIRAVLARKCGRKDAPIRGLTRENLGAVLVAPLPVGRVHHSNEKLVVHFQRGGEMARNMRRLRHDAQTENVVEHTVPASEVAITETANEIGAVEAERACAVQNKPSDGVRVFAVSRLDAVPPKVSR